jgi:hypothetical protein
VNKHRLHPGGWVGYDCDCASQPCFNPDCSEPRDLNTAIRDRWLFSRGVVLNHDQANELIASIPELRSLFAAAVGPARVQSVMLDLAAPAVWENEGGALRADTD